VEALNVKAEDSCIEKPELVNNPDFKGDISDLEYENGHLYVLERSRCLVSRIQVDTGHVNGEFSFTAIAYPDSVRLYQDKKGVNPTFPMAEALELTPDEIFIGIDNNGRKFNQSHPLVKQWAAKGLKDPVILVFKRPEGF